jgi:hypothetical protein
VAQGTGSSDGRRPRVARSRPNWWVILAVSLALMALLVATAGNPKRIVRGGAHGIANAQSSDSHGARGTGASSRSASASTARSTTTTAPVGAGANTAATALTSTHAAAAPPTTAPQAPATTTTTPVVVPTTTTTVAAPPLGAGSHQGVIEPPAQRSGSVAFTGSGAMQISVLWSGPTYLTMQVSCPSGDQNVGGSSAMQASLPDASGSCLATVSEPASESTALTYTITIGPGG